MAVTFFVIDRKFIFTDDGPTLNQYWTSAQCILLYEKKGNNKLYVDRTH